MKIVSKIKSRKTYIMPQKCCWCMRPKKQREIIKKRLSRMTEELDVVRFIRLQKQARFAVKTIFSRLQLWLLQNQKMFVINPDTDSSDARSSDECPVSERILGQEEEFLTFKKL